MFGKIKESDLTIMPLELRNRIISELTANEYGENFLILPILNILNTMIRDSPDGLEGLVKASGMYSIYHFPNNSMVRYIDDHHYENQEALIEYVFNDISFYDKSVIKYALDEYTDGVSVTTYRKLVQLDKIDSNTKAVIDMSVELVNNLIDYLKNEWSNEE